MADVITRLKLESGEYDSKIKRAVTGLQRMEDECRKVGGTLAILEKDQKQYVESLGRMQTVSTSVRGKIGELSSAYVELRSQYNRLTQEEKKGDFGKALSASLDQLKTRINDSKKELNDINAELGNMGKASNGTGGFVDALTQKLTINFDALTMLDKGLGMVNKGLDVAKEAFFSSEANVDAWGRTIASNESLYRSFLTTLNNSDISGFLGRIDQIIDAARKAYNELDRLGTMKTIQGPAVSAQQTENERMRMMIQTGRYIAPVDGRRASMANGTMLTAEQIRSIEQKLQQGMTKIVSLTSNEVKQTGRAIDAVYNRMAKENNMSMREFRKGTSSMAEFDKRMKGYEQYQKYEREHTMTSNRYNPQTGTYDTFTYRDQTKNPYQQYRNWGTFRVDAMGKGSYNELVDLIRQRDQQAAQAYGMQSQAFRTMNRAEGMTVSKIMRGETAGTTGGGTGRGGGKRGIVEEVFPEGSMKDLKRDMQELEKAQDLVTSPDEWQKYQQQIDAVTEKMNTLKGVVKQTATASVKAEKPTALDTFANSPISETSINAYLNALQQGVAQSDIGSGVQEALAAKLAEGDQLSQALQMAMDAGVQGADLTDVAQKIKDKMLEGGTMDAEQLQEFLDEINKYIENSDLKLKFDIDTKSITNVAQTNIKDAEKMTQNWQKASSAINTVSSAMQSLEDPAAKVMATIAQAIATIALSYAEASLMAAKNPLNAGWGWIAFAATGAATMISSIAAIHSATGYAEGGMIKGTSYSGDNIMANGGAIGLNAGELVLNKSQQFNLASQLEGDGSQGVTPSRPYVSGEQIYLGLNNYLRRSGRGEIVTSR